MKVISLDGGPNSWDHYKVSGVGCEEGGDSISTEVEGITCIWLREEIVKIYPFILLKTAIYSRNRINYSKK